MDGRKHSLSDIYIQCIDNRRMELVYSKLKLSMKILFLLLVVH